MEDRFVKTLCDAQCALTIPSSCVFTLSDVSLLFYRREVNDSPVLRLSVNSPAEKAPESYSSLAISEQQNAQARHPEHGCVITPLVLDNNNNDTNKL